MTPSPPHPPPPPPDDSSFPDIPVEDTPPPDNVTPISEHQYLESTTTDYQGLAEDIAQADQQQYAEAAVAAPIAGVASGLVGFEDVTGKPGVSEEDVEGVDQELITNVAVRAFSALVLLGFFLLALGFGGWWFSGLVILLLLVAVGEFYATVRNRGYAPVAVLGFLGLLGAGVGAHQSGAFGVGGMLLGGILLIILFYSVTVRQRALENAGLTILGMLWGGLGCFAILMLPDEQQLPPEAGYAGNLILLAVILTAVFDIAAFFMGRGFGRRQIAPHVSPSKTVEGLVGAVLLTGIVAAFLSTVSFFDPVIGEDIDLTWRAALLLAVVVSVLAPLGDASESVLKRSLGVKDMGTILPGHGGLLDRIDALLFVLPGTYVLFRMLNYL